jgi:hypothetical protein
MNEININRLELEEMTRRIAEAVVLLEEATQKIETHELITGKRLQTSEVYFNKRLEEITTAINELRELMTQAGVARFRVMAERALQEGRDHLLEIQKATEDFHTTVQGDVDYIHRTAENASNWIAEAIKSLKLDDFRRLMVESIDQIDEVSSNAVKRVTRLVNWFHWRRLGIAIVVALIASVLTAWFITDEAPWESHQHVVAERKVGKLWYQALPKLTKTEKDSIERMMSKYL